MNNPLQYRRQTYGITRWGQRRRFLRIPQDPQTGCTDDNHHPCRHTETHAVKSRRRNIMRRIFWLIWAVAMFPIIAWALISKKTDLILPLVLCVGLFVGLASLKRSPDVYLQSSLAWLSDFWNEIRIALGMLLIIAMIYGSTFVNWNKWGPVVGQISIIGIIASSLAWFSFSQHVKAYRHKGILFWGAWIAASLALVILINRWLILLPLIPFFFKDWEKRNEEINKPHRTPSH